jgi:biotin carboxyl carrier protein
MADKTVTAELSGRVISIAGAGADVNVGDDVTLIESMKMEIPVASPARGKVKTILVQIDDMVEEGQPLLVLEIG